jgi:hypothetical protein
MTNKNDILSYLRINLKQVANGVYEQDLGTTNRIGKLMDTIRDTIVFIETHYPEGQDRETD